MRTRSTLVDRPLRVSGRDIRWEHRLCHDGNAEDFFVDDHENPKDEMITKEAVQLCNTPCPIRDECARYALVNRMEFGVWGGLTAKQRRRIWRRKAA